MRSSDLFLFLPFLQLPVYQEGVSLGNIQFRNSGLQVRFDPHGQIIQANIDYLIIAVTVTGALLQVRLDLTDRVRILTCHDITRIKIQSLN